MDEQTQQIEETRMNSKSTNWSSFLTVALVFLTIGAGGGYIIGKNSSQSFGSPSGLIASSLPNLTSAPVLPAQSLQPVSHTCATTDIPGYDPGTKWLSENSIKATDVLVDFKLNGQPEAVWIYSEKVGSTGTRLKPIIVKVFSGSPNCYKEEFSYTTTGNELGDVQALTNFWGDGRNVAMVIPISTGYGSGYTSYMEFITYQNGVYQIVSGPQLSELTLYKFGDPQVKGKQIIVSKAAWENLEAHFDAHKYYFTSWDWDGKRYVKTELGTTKNKYGGDGGSIPISIESMIQAEPEVLQKQ